jgi:hypothetical protein
MKEDNGVAPADEIARAAAALIQPALFEPHVRRLLDEVYEKLMDTVQDYLVENAGYNIAARIDTAERAEREMRTELAAIDEALGRRWSDPESRCDLIRLLLTRHTDGQDTRRLDWLDKVNQRTNARNGNRYGWRYDINHNRAALTDCNAPYRAVRQAIDDAMIVASAPTPGLHEEGRDG